LKVFVESVLNGCTSSRISVNVSVLSLNATNFIDSTCAENSIVLSVPNLSGAQVYWYQSNGTFIQIGNTLTINANATDTLFYFEYVANNCTSNRASYVIKIFPKPFASFITLSEKDVPTDIQNATFTFYNNSQGGVRFDWYFGDGDSLLTSDTLPITHTYNVGEYFAMLCAYNEHNCLHCHEYGKLIIQDNYTIWIHNVFTPNNDGVNDLFKFELSGVKSIELEIYDRWGTLVYTNSNMNSFWDGNKNGKPCPEGVYIYHLKMVLNNGKSIKRFGNITLLR